jgi:hypothetical protein
MEQKSLTQLSQAKCMTKIAGISDQSLDIPVIITLKTVFMKILDLRNGNGGF